MESYTQAGTPGTDKGTDYLEHCAGFIWSMIDGPFGVNFDSDQEVAATITPQFDNTWDSSSAFVIIRGINVSLTYQNGHTELKAVESTENHDETKVVSIRLNQNGHSEIVNLRNIPAFKPTH